MLGGGLMGASIASFFAASGLDVTVLETSCARRAKLDELIRSQIEEIDGFVNSESAIIHRFPVTISANLAAAVTTADMVIESVPEDRAIKRSVWAEVGLAAAPHAILATNTSSLGVTELSRLVPAPSRVVGIHFFNPAHILPGVEVVLTEQTDPKVADLVVGFLTKVGKEPVIVKDTPGFVVNRLQFALIAEALRLIDEGVANANDIDRLIETTIGPRWLAGGPMISADAAGLDVYANILGELREKLGDRYALSDIMKTLVAQDSLGVKTGRGLVSNSPDFYSSSQESRNMKLRKIMQTRLNTAGFEG